ncbi:MAG: peptidoglycan DD-metalloendopeptidase family protein [Sulfuricurvum sp.]
MRFSFSLMLIPLISVSLYGGGKIDERIKTTASELKNTKETYSSLNAKLTETATKIAKQRQVIGVQQQHIDALASQLQSKSTIYHSSKMSLVNLQSQQITIAQTQNEIEKKLVLAIAKNTSLSSIISDDRAKDANALITEEILKLHRKQINQEVQELTRAFSLNNTKITALSHQTMQLEQTIAQIDQQKEKVVATKQENEQAVVLLNKEKESYKRSLERVIEQQRSLQSTLASLNIIKRQQRVIQRPKAPPKMIVVKQTIIKEGKKVTSTKTIQETPSPTIDPPSRRAQYNGERGISPLDGYVVTKSFGPYTDPVYGIKSYSESVFLRPTETDAKVKTIFNGKIILAKSTAMLKNLIIIEHDNGLHTIYAHLSSIAPTVLVGQRIKQGSVIGRVGGDLLFEVTQRNAHINPMQVIR